MDVFAEIDENKGVHKKFYEQWKRLKRGGREDVTNRTKVAKRMRYHTSKSGDEQISFKDGPEESQNDIFYITGECIAAGSSSPLLENLRMKGLEVLYMMDPTDECAVQQLQEFGGKKLEQPPSRVWTLTTRTRRRRWRCSILNSIP